MDLKQIRYFIAIVDYGNFREAAEACYISQSAISQQIQALENNLGFQLLIRKNRKFELTPVGKYIYDSGKDLLKKVEEIEKEARVISKTENKTLKIGYLKNYSGNELQNSIMKFSEKLPDVGISIQSGAHFDLSEKVFNDELDMKFADQRRVFSEEFINFPVCTLFFYIKVPKYNEYASKKIISLDELKGKTCIIISSNDEADTEKKFYYDILGFKTDFIFARTVEEANLLVASNKGFLPIEANIGEEDFDSDIRMIPLYFNNNQMSRKYYAFWKKENNNQLIEEFANILSDEFKK